MKKITKFSKINNIFETKSEAKLLENTIKKDKLTQTNTMISQQQ